MNLKFVTHRQIACPTMLGWACLLILALAPCLLWCFAGEQFLSHTERLPAQVLVVDGWIGAEGIHAAKEEFRLSGYDYVVTTGGLSGQKWESRRWSYAAEAEEQLLRSGIPRDRVILATPLETEAQRTFATAVAVRDALRASSLHPTDVNLFTRSSHARRSRLVFAKVLGPNTKVGVIAWSPPGFESEAWWKSSERAVDLLKETVGYGFELLLNSGRLSNSPTPKAP